MSSSSAYSTVTYTSDSDASGQSFSIPLVDVYGYESDASEAALQSPEHTPLSLAYASEYTAPADDDLEPTEAQALPAPAKEDPEEEEDDLPASAASTLARADPASPSEETGPFEEDEVAPIPPSPISTHYIIPLSQTRLRRARKLARPQTPLPPSIDAHIQEWLAAPTPPSLPPSPLSPLSSPLSNIPLSSPTPRDPILKPGSTLAQGTKDRLVVALEETNEREMISAPAIDRISARSQRVADALADYEANQNSRNGNDNGNESHDSRSGGGRTSHTARVCTYKEFLNFQPLNFKGTEGTVGLAYWSKKLEFVFHISNCTVECQVKYATCTLLGGALTWWNSYVRIVGHNATYEMP
ncbi:hypothetical protein Tco_1174197 [Tanacetum coccineum]